MSKVTKADLKAKFTTGKTPSQQDYFDLIDSLVHLDDQSAVDQQVVNTRISAYDTALKARQADGVVNTLGDVFNAFVDYDDNRNINNELKWAGLPGKPTILHVTWSEQVLVTDETRYNPLGASGTAGSGPSQRWLFSEVAPITTSHLFMDMRLDRRWVATSAETGYYADRIIAVKLAIDPSVIL